MKTKLNSNIRILFYSLWALSLLLQAYFTEITSDEAYYWMYSKQLAWGYFDHPPVIAFIIKLGYALFPNELGVRLIPIILSTLTIYVLERIIKPKDIKTFFMLVASVGILHFIGFFAIPDSPFIFLFIVYLYLYKDFIISPNLKKSFLLGSVVALMCLSKYHSIIIIGLTILSNRKLLTNRYFWLSAIIAFTLLVPHILWQIKTGFPSINYHLFERSTESYKATFTIEYVLSQLVVMGPITGIIFFIAAIKEKAVDQFEKTLKFLFWGGYIFFFFMSFKGRVEGHWTLFTVLPALYFGYRYLIKLNNPRRIINYIFSISILLIIFGRLLIVIDFKTRDSTIVSKLTKSFRNKDNMLAIKRLAGDHKVAFMNSYQKASLYSFYSKSEGFSLNNIMGRKNQFDIWNVEDTYRGQTILMIPNYDSKEFSRIQGISNIVKYTFIENFQSFSAIKITATGLGKVANRSDTLNVKLTLSNTKNKDVNFSVNRNYTSYVYYQFFEGRMLIKEKKGFKITNDMLERDLNLDVITPDKKGNYGLYFNIKTGWLPPTINSQRYNIKIN